MIALLLLCALLGLVVGSFLNVVIDRVPLGESVVKPRSRCPGCGTEIAGTFAPCRFCRLPVPQQQLLEVFLRSRGNMREVQAHLGVSYPTARQRYAELLQQLGLAGADGSPAGADDEAGILADLAAGRITVEQAEELLGVS